MQPSNTPAEPRTDRDRRRDGADRHSAVVQVWLLSATLDAFLAGHREVAIPGAVASGSLFLMCAALYRFIVRLEHRSAKDRSV